MRLEKIQIGEKRVMPLAICAGTFITQISALERAVNELDGIGIFTTKSMGLKPRIIGVKPNQGSREPILVQYCPGSFLNAVKLTNLGVDEYAKELSLLDIPKDKAVVGSIFDNTVRGFRKITRRIEDHVDALEINFSCAHSEGFGIALGQYPKTVYEVTKAVVEQTRRPVFVKLSHNIPYIADAKAAKEAGASGISAINTVGPMSYEVDGFPVLTNKKGSLSGAKIKDIGIECVREIRQAVGKDFFINGIGGIRIARDIEDYLGGGANAVSVGSAWAGMNEENKKEYLSVIVDDLANGTNNAAALLPKVDMTYKKVRIEKKIGRGDFKIFKTNQSISAEPGQYVFAWIPEVGEKPFSVMDDGPLTLGILKRGCFTKHFNSLQEGDSFYFRGPYGQSIDVPKESNVVLVGGGSGIAGLYLAAKRFSKKANVTMLLGAKNSEHLLYLSKFYNLGKLKIITDDGSSGKKGVITDLFGISNLKEGSYFFNCGPKAMVDGVLPLESQILKSREVRSSTEYRTSCGVGLCGNCADKKGRLTCQEGTFMKHY